MFVPVRGEMVLSIFTGKNTLTAAGRMAGLGARPRIVRPAEERPALLELLLRRGRAMTLPHPFRALDAPGWPRPQFIIPH